MSDTQTEKPKMVILMASGTDTERSSVAWSIAVGAVKSGFDLTVFLTAAAVDWARKGAAEKVRPNPMDPTIGHMMNTCREFGCKILVCPPCADVRNYTPECLIDGVELIGSGAMHKLIKAGAATLCF